MHRPITATQEKDKKSMGLQVGHGPERGDLTEKSNELGPLEEQTKGSQVKDGMLLAAHEFIVGWDTLYWTPGR